MYGIKQGFLDQVLDALLPCIYFYIFYKNIIIIMKKMDRISFVYIKTTLSKIW